MKTKKKDTRNEIVQTAKRLFARSGYSGVSVRDIATEAGVNVGAVSYYFGGKEGLYREVVEQGQEQLRRILAEVAFRKSPVRQKTEEFIEAFFEFHLRDDSVSRIMLSEMLFGGTARALSDGHFSQMNLIITSIVDQANSELLLEDYDSTLTVLSFLSLPLFLVFAKPVVERLRGEKGYSKDFIRDVAKHTVRLMFEGLEARGNGKCDKKQ